MVRLDPPINGLRNLLGLPLFRSRYTAPILGVALWVTVAGWGLGAYPLGEPDEGRNGTAAWEVATEGRWVLPTYDGLEFVDKPPLWFGTAAVALRLLGKEELAIRLPSLVFTAASLILLFWFARRLYGTHPAWVSAAAFASSPLVLAYARIAIFDAMVSFFVLSSLALLHESIEGTAGMRQPGPTLLRPGTLAWVSMTCGFLTKGPVAVAVPLVVAVPYAIWRDRAPRLLSWPGVLTFAAVAAAWIGYVELRVEGFLEYVLVNEIWGRLGPEGVATANLGTTGPIGNVAAILLLGALPWSVVAAWSWMGIWTKALRRGQASGPRPSTVFLLLWLVLPTLLLSFARPLRLHYLLPVIPAVALLLGAAAARDGVSPWALRAGAVPLIVVGGALAAVGADVWPLLEKVPDGLRGLAHTTALAVALLCLVPPVVSWSVARRRSSAAWILLAIPGFLFPLVGFPLSAAVAEARSSEGLARSISEACPEAPVVGIEFLPASLPFYLGRPVGLASSTGEAFQSNYVEARWGEIVARNSRDPLLTRDWWSELSERTVVVFEREDEFKGWAAEALGFERVAVNRLFEAWGRRCRQWRKRH